MGPRILPSARKHGVPDSSIRHAVDVPFRIVEIEPNLILLIGPDEHGKLLELVIADPHDDARVIHAMTLRPRFFKHLT